VILAVLVASCCLLTAAATHAQTHDDPPPPPGYDPAIPDIGGKELDKTAVNTHWFTFRLGLAPIFDYTWFTQDAPSIEQVGVQENAFQVRSGRIQARGKIFARRSAPWRYLFSFEYRGFDSNPDETWNFTDVAVTIPVGRVLGELTLGKIKEPFVYEMVGDAANLPQIERLMSPFFVSRNIGGRLDNTLLQQRMTWSFGAFNDWWTSEAAYNESGWQVDARVTGLAYTNAPGSRYLHLGTAWRYNGADKGTLRFRGKPESNVTSNYVDTGSIAGDHSDHVGLEVLLNEGPFSVTAEYVHAFVDAPGVGDPSFHGYYVTGAYVLTGEHRPYDRKVGYARRILPRGRWGAYEVVGRFGLVDLNDAAVSGGVLQKSWVGLNWWANRRWRVTGGYGRARLNKLGVVGYTNQYFTRVQWIY
jgi:phosphate-selective porin OprO/OprP